MTNELVELENNYFVLCHLLLQRIAKDKPKHFDDTKSYLAKIEKYSIYEKMLYVAELLQATKSKEQSKVLQQIEKSLKQEKISDTTISLMKQYIHLLK